MILFKIAFFYNGKEIEASVHEIETPPKQWHITVEDNSLPIEFRTTYFVHYDYTNKKYVWDFLAFDTDNSFVKSMTESLMNYISKYGLNSVNN